MLGVQEFGGHLIFTFPFIFPPYCEKMQSFKEFGFQLYCFVAAGLGAAGLVLFYFQEPNDLCQFIQKLSSAMSNLVLCDI